MSEPRIYVYKITFLEVPHYYYGMHEEKKFDEYYMGSPRTNKDYWKKYTPQKEILYTFTTRKDAYRKEKELISEVFNKDPYCLNRCCNGVVDIQISINAGKKCYELKKGVHGLSEEKRKENSKKGAEKNREQETGIFNLTEEQRKRALENSHNTNKLNKTGFYGISKEKHSENGKKAIAIQRELGIGFFGGISEEQIKINASKGGKVGGKVTSAQIWECTETGFQSKPGPLTVYQRNRGIDPSKRIRIK
jgi:hypothetical protein